MDIELLEIRDFLAANHPFDQLPEAALSELPTRLQVRYFRRDTVISETNSLDSYLYLIRTGAVEMFSAENELLARLGEGDVFGYRASRRPNQIEHHCTALEDALIYQLSAQDVDRLCEHHTQFAYFFGSVVGDRLRDAVSHAAQVTHSQVNLITTPISELLKREPVSISPSASIYETAKKMAEERVSSILVIAKGQLAGIVTDRDLRNRVVAEALDVNLPITEIMTFNPTSLKEDAFAFQAQLHMARHNIHHLPITRGEGIAGMITATDLTKHQTTSVVYMVSDIFKQDNIQHMREVADKIPDLLVNMAAAEASADSVGHVITSITDAITTRLLQLAEERLGAPPVRYVWVAAGSQARNEQTAKSDQDNCMIIDDTYDPKLHGDYFKELAKFVCDGLNACGYVYCPGEMMATTDKWRQPLRVWKEYFSNWITQPEPMSLMLTSVFFDMRRVYGSRNLFRDIADHALEMTRGNRIFLAFMSGNALSHQPPIGFFRNFVLIKGGEHNQTFDVKHNGIVPIVDLARVYSLAAGSKSVNTLDRLEVVAEGGEITSEGARDLKDALEFISYLRIQHQARLIKAGQPADNFMSPDHLSHFERNHLKDAFSVVRSMQNVLSQRYKM
ncbi:MAG: cyclic nucleotide-binding/CBS domain-containing protein [Gammaproteobacteria bacterium]|nr:cyclic nucleotide-binding/CBS domain-containing protein [Gammaproteobacteria bacterium]